MCQSSELVALVIELQVDIICIQEHRFFHGNQRARSRIHPAKRIIDADYADDLALLANRVADVETLLHALEEAAFGIGLYVNAIKTGYICFNKHGKIQSLNGTYLNKVEHFTYLGVLNKSWKHHPTKAELYGTLQSVSATIRERRARFAGHCYRHKDEFASEHSGHQPMDTPAQCWREGQTPGTVNGGQSGMKRKSGLGPGNPPDLMMMMN
ncbi:hypothetical protein Bbelb_391230 [Branchiostoma belcheri]|nr:hypothetical protein Bbelb_391230 [Branchiostoma belcheri]